MTRYEIFSKKKSETAILIIFSIAMAYVEAMVVVYLRRLPAMSECTRLSSFRDVSKFVEKAGIMWSEQTREFATLVMLFSIAFLFGKNTRERIAGFLIAFGVWDIFYYIFLYLWLGWPENLLEWDILFLIPCPWISPVIIPIGISMIMISAGFCMLKTHRLHTACSCGEKSD